MRSLHPGLTGLLCTFGAMCILVASTLLSPASALPLDDTNSPLSFALAITPTASNPPRTEAESGPQLTKAVWRMAIGQAVVDAGATRLGAPYVYGASGPNVFDCSGFIRWAWLQLGVELPHNSVAQWNVVERIRIDQLQPGDLVFNSEGGGSPGHVGIYVGDGMMIHSPSSGNVVRYDPLSWWTGATTTAGRVR